MRLIATLPAYFAIAHAAALRLISFIVPSARLTDGSSAPLVSYDTRRRQSHDSNFACSPCVSFFNGLLAFFIMTRETLAEVLESPRCACGAPKRMQQPFCLVDFTALPRPTIRAYFQRIQHATTLDASDQDAYNAALDYLERHVYVNQS